MAGYSNTIQSYRGIAVWLVVLYHCSFVFGGGFIGVDVFFVISGFVIARSIVLQIESGETLSRVTKDFYIRRIHRLVPALSVTTGCVTLSSVFVFSPYGEIQKISRAAISTVLFISNAWFFVQNDYTALTDNPFRHSWSLAVEEQFYLVFPLLSLGLAFASRRRFRKSLFLAAIGIALISFVVSVVMSYGVRLTPLPMRFAFFSPVTRGWQFFVGVAVATFPVMSIGRKLLSTRFTSQFSQLVGLSLILYSAWAFEPYGAYPGLRSVIPTMGICLALIATINNLDLGMTSLALFRHSGNISYSFYLIHWPILVLLRKLFGDILLINLVSLPLAYVLAMLQFQFIEERFRIKRPQNLLSESR